MLNIMLVKQNSNAKLKILSKIMLKALEIVTTEI